MATRKYTRPDGAVGTHVVAIGLTCWSDGTYTGTLSAWEPGGERMRHYPILGGTLDGAVAPPGIEALAHAGQLALDLWMEGRVG